eukprot:gene10276-11372_t
MSFELPVINISCWTENLPSVYNQLTAPQREVANQWNDFMTRYGFVVLEGHALPAETFQTLYSESIAFFSQSLESKVVHRHGKYGHPLGGYTPPGSETVALSVVGQSNAADVKPQADPVESFVYNGHPCKYSSPFGEPSPIQSAASYYDEMEKVLRTLHRISCATLNLPSLDEIERYYDETLHENKDLGTNGNALRLAHYLGDVSIQSLGLKNKVHSSIRYGAHTDYQGYTLLKPDPKDWKTIDGCLQGGLEVYLPCERVWQRVALGEEHSNALVINVGDLMQRWTNDRWLSPLHRVTLDTEMINSVSQKTHSRLSLVFFSGPLDKAVVEPFASCVDEGQNSKYGPILSGDHLQQKLNRTNEMVELALSEN